MPTSTSFHRFSKSSLSPFFIFSLVYFLWFVFIIGIQQNNIGLFLLIALLYFLNSSTRKFLFSFSPFILFLILYDSLRILHDLNLFEIHSEDLYALDKSLFGLMHEGNSVSLNEYFLEHRHSILDFLSGAFYLSWIPFPILFGISMFLQRKHTLVFNFWMSFLITNLIGFLGYIFYPAAPPWYYLEYGAEIIKSTLGQAAGLASFDQIIGYPIFTNMYSQSANVFGAVPSLHAAYPMILSYYSFKNKNRILSLVFLTSMVGIWFAAIYTTHHYMLDVILGIICGVLGIMLSEWILKSKGSSITPNFSIK